MFRSPRLGEGYRKICFRDYGSQRCPASSRAAIRSSNLLKRELPYVSFPVKASLKRVVSSSSASVSSSSSVATLPVCQDGSGNRFSFMAVATARVAAAWLLKPFVRVSVTHQVQPPSTSVSKAIAPPISLLMCLASFEGSSATVYLS